MSNKTEFKDVLITNINHSKDGNYAFFTIEDTRTFNDKTRIHKFNITAKADILDGIATGDRVIIEASLISKEYEHNNQIKTSWSIWASKVYWLVALKTKKQPTSQTVVQPYIKPTNEEPDVPF